MFTISKGNFILRTSLLVTFSNWNKNKQLIIWILQAAYTSNYYKTMWSPTCPGLLGMGVRGWYEITYVHLSSLKPMHVVTWGPLKNTFFHAGLTEGASHDGAFTDQRALPSLLESNSRELFGFYLMNEDIFFMWCHCFTTSHVYLDRFIALGRKCIGWQLQFWKRK